MVGEAVVVIPARLHSTRLPRKLLLRARGKTVLQWTIEAAKRAKLPKQVFAAVDGEELAAAAEKSGAIVVWTGDERTGTDRVASAISAAPWAEIVVNVQADEPEIDPAHIDMLINLLKQNQNAAAATLATAIRSRQVLESSSAVKVVTDANRRALWFSRAPIPSWRSWSSDLLERDPPAFLRHLGAYAYRSEWLPRLHDARRSPAEELEDLEQLRFLHLGMHVHVGIVSAAWLGIDTAADFEAFRHRVESNTAG